MGFLIITLFDNDFDNDFNSLTNAQRRFTILELQNSMLDLEQVEMPLTHHFTEGNYARELLIKEGTIVVGKIHKHAHFNFIMKGRCIVATEDGIKELQAPLMFASEVGTKRAVLAIEDTVWITIHPTDSQDLDKIEEEVIANDFEQLNQYLLGG